MTLTSRLSSSASTMVRLLRGQKGQLASGKRGREEGEKGAAQGRWPISHRPQLGKEEEKADLPMKTEA